MKTSQYRLTTDAEWQTLASDIAINPAAGPIAKILSHLKDLGAQFAICEDAYLDRDFSAEFAEFYSKLFKRYGKLCKRFHFFSANIEPVLQQPSPLALAQGLEAAQENYLGFVVVRPVPHAPIGRTVIRTPTAPASQQSKVLVRAGYEVHLLGATLQITGMPLVQQDSRVGACAQAAIWMAGRHFHARHRGPWFSVAQITQEASKPADVTLSRTLPAGSGFLSLDNMIRALRAMGREPFCLGAIDRDPVTLSWIWPPEIRVADAIHRYVDSGIPVILGIAARPPDQVGHAIVATGHTIKLLPAGARLPSRPTRAEFCEFFLVNDDQRGCSLRMPFSEGFTGPPAGTETPYSLNWVHYILVPLPNKVFLPAETAEVVAWDYIEDYPRRLAHLQANGLNIGAAIAQAQAFAAEIAARNVVARTYLTYGWRYRHRLLRNRCADTLKAVAVEQELPRYVWVTEFGTSTSLNHLDPARREIFAHLVADATSSQHEDATLLYHAPGVIHRWFHNPTNPAGSYELSIVPVPDERPYLPKVRGQ